MSKKELLLIASRTFALLLFTYAVTELTYLPERIFSLYHHLEQKSVLNGAPEFWETYYMLATVLLLLRMSALLFAAVVFWKCGPRIQRLFTEPSTSAEN